MDRRAVLGAGLALMMSAMAEAQDDTVLSSSQVFHYDKLPVKKNANGGESRQVMSGKLASGEPVEMHMTTLPAGKMPHPPHKHHNSEFVMIREGNVEYLADGIVDRMGPGDLVFTASMQPHGMRNIGTTPAKYFVVSVGSKGGEAEVTLKPVA